MTSSRKKEAEMKLADIAAKARSYRARMLPEVPVHLELVGGRFELAYPDPNHLVGFGVLNHFALYWTVLALFWNVLNRLEPFWTDIG